MGGLTPSLIYDTRGNIFTPKVLFDNQVHHSVQTALASLGTRGPQCQVVPHANLDRLETGIRTALAKGARRVWYCADGIYSMFGDRLPVDGLIDLMNRYEALHAYLDDAHGMSWCGSRGGGSLIDAPLPVERTVIATSLSKAFGCTGGMIAVPDQLTKQRIENLLQAAATWEEKVEDLDHAAEVYQRVRQAEPGNTVASERLDAIYRRMICLPQEPLKNGAARRTSPMPRQRLMGRSAASSASVCWSFPIRWKHAVPSPGSGRTNVCELLRQFWARLAQDRTTLFITHNGIGFDLPFIKKR